LPRARRGEALLLIARNMDRLQQLGQRIARETGRVVETLGADLRDRKDLAMVEARLGKDQRITMLLNNAGVGAKARLLEAEVGEMSDMVPAPPPRDGGAVVVTTKSRLSGRIQSDQLAELEGLIASASVSLVLDPQSGFRFLALYATPRSGDRRKGRHLRKRIGATRTPRNP